MPSGRRTAGERVLEGKHVIGLFLLMLLFSGVFFTLGYVMGRNQFSGQVSAENSGLHAGEPAYIPSSKPVPAPKKVIEANESVTDPSGPIKSEGWDFSETKSPADSEPRLDSPPKPVPTTTPAAAKTVNTKATAAMPTAAAKNVRTSTSAPLIPNGALLLQVAALTKQDDALEIASSLQKKHFAAYVQPPQRDKFYRVQVGPFKDQKAAEAAKKGLEGAGYRAFYVKH
jgi:cell division septation protein DedD